MNDTLLDPAGSLEQALSSVSTAAALATGEALIGDSLSQTPTDLAHYSIRVASDPGTPCVICGEATGAGPVGYRGEDPICDRDLLESCHVLGMVMALVAVARASAAAMMEHPEAGQDAMKEVGAFIRIYERFAAKSGPPRMFRLGLQ